MADTVNYFDAERGFSIEEITNIIPVDGPPGVSGDSTTVGPGSMAMDYSTVPAGLYVKRLAGAGVDKWSKLADMRDLDMTPAERIDFQNNETVIYNGEADPGSLDNQPVWRIKRTTLIEPSTDLAVEVVVEWADGDAEFDNIWDNHLSLPYS